MRVHIAATSVAGRAGLRSLAHSSGRATPCRHFPHGDLPQVREAVVQLAAPVEAAR